MPKFLKVDTFGSDGNIIHFLCPGCKGRHSIITGGVPEACQFNENFDSPTISPSVLVTWAEGEAKIKKACHSYIKNGMIQFLNDCTHELKGQIVPLPEISEDKYFIRD